MSIEDFIGISVVGGLLSLVIQFIKGKLGTESLGTKVLTVVLSIIVGGAYFFVRDTVWYPSILGVLAASSTVYAMFLK